MANHTQLAAAALAILMPSRQHVPPCESLAWHTRHLAWPPWPYTPSFGPPPKPPDAAHGRLSGCRCARSICYCQHAQHPDSPHDSPPALPSYTHACVPTSVALQLPCLRFAATRTAITHPWIALASPSGRVSSLSQPTNQPSTYTSHTLTYALALGARMHPLDRHLPLSSCYTPTPFARRFGCTHTLLPTC